MFTIDFFCHSVPNCMKYLGAKKCSCHTWMYLISKIVPLRGCLGAAEGQTMGSAAAVMIVQRRADGNIWGQQAVLFLLMVPYVQECVLALHWDFNAKNFHIAHIGDITSGLKLRLSILHAKYFLVLQYFNVKNAHKMCHLNKKKVIKLCDFGKV